MSSATSTDRSAFQPWQFFVLSGLAAATASVLLARDTGPSNLILISLTIFAAAFAGIAMYKTLWPLATPDLREGAEALGRRTRAALEREKTLVLRSIKELEFDRAMGKLSDQDFQEMSSRLRARAVSLIRQLDLGESGYRELIERELQARVRRTAVGRATLPVDKPFAPDANAAASAVALVPVADLQPVQPSSVEEIGADAQAESSADRAVCPGCGTRNDDDARFCKTCGSRLD